MLQHLPWGQKLQKHVHENSTVFSLRVAITVVALLYIFLAWTVDNKWFLGGLLFWEVSP